MINKTIGARCKAWRLAHGITQGEIAKDVGCQQSNISRFESGLNDNMYILLWYLDHGMALDKEEG